MLASLHFRDHFLQQRAVGGRQPVRGAVGAVHRERRQQFSQRSANRWFFRRYALLLRNAGRQPQQRGEFAFEIPVGHQQFGVAQFGAHIHLLPDHLLIRLAEILELRVIHQHIRERGDKFIPRRAGNRPVIRDLLALTENFFHGDVAIRPGFFAQPLQIRFRIGKAVDVIHPQAIHRAGVHQVEDQPVAVVKHGVIFNAHARQPGNFKKTAVGERARRIAPGD